MRLLSNQKTINPVLGKQNRIFYEEQNPKKRNSADRNRTVPNSFERNFLRNCKLSSLPRK
ncbi:hypothetical protein DLM76_14560 [Leptospira yasudae]|uniref:Uncharacterized protein n=1 Tax=Leptospira yasudae TaxID=2202201 RepID=A0ABX9M1G9_9LEPT|nr:hypothetical protein DLM77_14840 [Leptospira yasudae]RHX93303.1 hypothetical protein DLM76_14560 [Leptospira yasudae]